MKPQKPSSKRASKAINATSTKRLEWSPRADDDKFHVWLFIAEANLTAADEVLERIEHAAELLPRFPLMGRKGRVPATRELPVAQTPFILVYRISAYAVRIGRVLHHARRYP